MWSLIRSRPCHCLRIGAQALAWGEVSRTWRGRHRYRCVLSPTPKGVLKLSPIDVNVVDVAALESRLRSLAGSSRQFRMAGRVLLSDIPRPITLLLPDLSVRTTMLHLDQFPKKAEEQEALIRWRLGQEQLVPLTGAKVIWQVFPAGRADVERSQTVLVVAIQEAILHQYESLCESVGLLPQEVGVTSFRLFDLWLKAVGGRRRLDRDIMWVSVLDGGLTCFILHAGRLAFVRTKLLTSDGQSWGDELEEAMVEKIVAGCAASLAACQARHPALNAKDLVLVTDGPVAALEQALGLEFGLGTEVLDWEHVEHLGWVYESGSTSIAALSVVAGVM
jgi:hypothetical protein